MRKGLWVLAVALCGLLAACEDSEQRAEKHYQSAIELVQAGDIDRAVIEFRNVFQLNPQHLEARLAFASLLDERGNSGAAFREYLQAYEQAPDNVQAVSALARLAAYQGNWDEAGKYLDAALVLAPEDPELGALSVGRAYADALREQDNAARREAARAASDVLRERPDHPLLRRMVVDNALRDRNFESALAELDTALALSPEDDQLYRQRLAVLTQLQDFEGVEAGLLDLIDRFPEDADHPVTLVRWYVSRGDVDKAEAYLRSTVASTPDDNAPKLQLIGFLRQVRSPEAALEELNAMIAAGEDDPVFAAMRAGFRFDGGDRSTAIAEMQQLLDGAEASDQTRNFGVALARMHLAQGDAVSARALVENVLAEDAGHVEALKLKAGWQIEDDQLSDAIALLRSALEQSPDDAAIMTLMAQAYERGGDTQLMAEMLALAVEASGNAPQESIRYAAYLSRDDKLIPAETVLLDSLRLHRNNVDLLIPLGRLYVQLEDWGRTETVAAALDRLNTDAARVSATQLRTTVLQAQNKSDEALGFLQGLVDEGTGGIGAKVAIVRSHIAAGEPEKARSYAAEILAENPDNASLRFMQGAVFAALGDIADAEEVYSTLLAENDQRQRVWSALYRLQLSDGRPDEARATLDRALEAVPGAPDLLWLQAGNLEADRSIEEAIAIYEEMYAQNSSNTVIANNLASLLASYRTDPESLERAFTVARRLRGTTFAPFQDTYGWLVHLRGNSAEALTYLEPAAEALSTDPLVQFHLAEIYAALNRSEDALIYYRRALDIAGELDERDFIQSARAAVQQLENPGASAD